MKNYIALSLLALMAVAGLSTSAYADYRDHRVVFNRPAPFRFDRRFDNRFDRRMMERRDAARDRRWDHRPW